MKTELIAIGNSRGIRIPKPLIKECGLGKAIELRVENRCLIISQELKPRAGWAEAFRAAGPAMDDEILLDSPALSKFDETEWRW